MSKLLPNLPIEDLTTEKDYLNIIDKGNLIRTLLESNMDEFAEIKMFVLYGEWGSGKSTLMKYLKKELKNTFNPFFFEAWEFESDSNLSLSLLEFLTKKSESISEEFAREILDIGGRLLKGLTKSIKVTVPLPFLSPESGISIKAKELVESYENKREKTFIELKEEFKTEFVRWEDLTTKGDDQPDYNIIFIDDLDRCEPENVLNLLSALKLFFTYGKKTIFFCGIDKKAVEEAVKTKYGEVVKSNEYLEKIFDISFSMPKENEVLKLVRNYFPSSKPKQQEIEDNWDKLIADFFTEIKFLNPRKIKKVLNKYHLLRHIKTSKESGRYLEELPNIFKIENDKSSFFETILVIYFIVLEEFYPEKSSEILNMNVKRGKYLEYIRKSDLKNSSMETSVKNYFDNNYVQLPLNKITEKINSESRRNEFMGNFFICLAPSQLEAMENFPLEIGSIRFLITKSETIDYLFFRFFLSNAKKIISDDFLSDLSLLQIKNSVLKFL